MLSSDRFPPVCIGHHETWARLLHGQNTSIEGVTEVKKIMTLTLVLTVLAMLVGFGVNNARADDDDVEWDFVETTHFAEVEVKGTVIGSIDVEFWITHLEEGGIGRHVELRTTFGEFEEGLDGEEINIEIDFDEGVPISGEAELSTHIEGCGEIKVGIRFVMTDEGEWEIGEKIIHDGEGIPFEREVEVEVEVEVIESEIVEVVICGIDFLGDILGDGEVSGIILVSEFFESSED